jgi:dTDP-4-dehydrorhamnose reductase
VINCAAWTDVDAAETHEERATAVNGTAVGVLAAACAASDATLMHFSTDYVFSGHAVEPYSVDAPRAPLGAYGRSKLAGERLLEASECRYHLLRTSWVYAPWGKNFVRTIARLPRERDTLRVVNDQIGRPSSASWIAHAAWRHAGEAQPGTYKLKDGVQCSWFGFAVAVAQALGRRCDIQPCTSEEFPRPAKRPSYSVLDNEATVRLLGPFPKWPDNLKEVLEHPEMHAL